MSKLHRCHDNDESNYVDEDEDDDDDELFILMLFWIDDDDEDDDDDDDIEDDVIVTRTRTRTTTTTMTTTTTTTRKRRMMMMIFLRAPYMFAMVANMYKASGSQRLIDGVPHSLHFEFTARCNRRCLLIAIVTPV